MEWKNEIYDYEVTPPTNVWDKIAQDLDNKYIVFKDTLSYAEQTPPENVWNKIVQDLDNEYIVFKNKLSHAEQTPPENVWRKIVHKLDDEYIVFKDILFDAQETPPPNAWHNIQSVLDNGTSQKGRLISLRSILKISAAAAVIAILFFTTNYFFKTKEAAVNNTTAVKNTNNNAEQKIADRNKVEERENNKNEINQPKEKEKQYVASNTETIKSRKQENNQRAKVFSDGGSVFVPAPSIEIIPTDQSSVTDKYDLSKSYGKRVRNLQGEIKEDVSLLDLPNSYFLMTGPDGQSIRVSSKFRNTIQYLNGAGNEELLDVILRESRYWKNIFREWKEKVGNSTFVPAANNFMDIAELMQLLRQNSGK